MSLLFFIMKIKCKIFITFWCLIFINCLLKAQVNLVMNPSFEELDSCPSTGNDANYAKHWNWINNTCSSACQGELYISCGAINSLVSTPTNSIVKYQKAKTGSGYIGLISINYAGTGNNTRQYVKGILNANLQATKEYCLTFYYVACKRSKYISNRFGAYVDDGSISAYNCCNDIPITPQAENNPAVFMSDTINWIKIQNHFTAIGNENTITLGNFVDSTIIQYQLLNGSGTLDPYYLLDDVSLIPMDLPAYAGNDTTINLNDSAYIGRTNEVGLNDDCIWYVLGNSTAIDTIAGMWVKPQTTTSYVVEQNICGSLSYDTIVVTVNTSGINQVKNLQTEFEIYPNPASGILNIVSPKKTIMVVISSLLGRDVLQTQQNEVDISFLPNGVYFLNLISEEGNFTRKIIIQH